MSMMRKCARCSGLPPGPSSESTSQARCLPPRTPPCPRHLMMFMVMLAATAAAISSAPWTSLRSLRESSSSRLPSQVQRLLPKRSATWPSEGNVPDLPLPLMSGLRLCDGAVRRPVQPDVQGTFFVEAFNASGGRDTLKTRLTKTKAMILLCQEIGYIEDSLDDLYSWAQNRQWKCSAIPARRAS
eukprot:9396735-Pyramimonas_sp.AAC.1